MVWSSKNVIPLAALLATVSVSVPAQAEQPLQVFFGYGQMYQTRQDIESSAHLLTVGAIGRLNDELFGTFDVQFGIDQDYDDFSHMSMSVMVGYALGPEWLSFWIGGGLRFGLDGYPNPSASLYDPGLGVGLFGSIGGWLGVGTDLRGWLGWNFYSDRRSDEISMEFEPYFEWRMYLSVGF